MKIIYEIVIPFTEIGCNPDVMRIERDESKEGAEKLYNHLNKKFPGRVTLYKDTSEKSQTFVMGKM